MSDFSKRTDLKDARVIDSDISGAHFRSVNFSNVKITDAWLFNADFHGAIGGLRINGVRVEPLIEAELDRRHPERMKLRPTDVEGVLAAYDVVDEMWAPTIDRARKLPTEKLHERVDHEYSFVETFRHLIFATDAWLTRMVLGVPDAYHEWALPPDLPLDAPPDTGPDLDPVLDVRNERNARIRGYLKDATDADLASMQTAPDPTGHPQGTHKVLDCFLVIFNEEWWHHQYATRDLSALEGA